MLFSVFSSPESSFSKQFVLDYSPYQQSIAPAYFYNVLLTHHTPCLSIMRICLGWIPSPIPHFVHTYRLGSIVGHTDCRG